MINNSTIKKKKPFYKECSPLFLTFHFFLNVGLRLYVKYFLKKYFYFYKCINILFLEYFFIFNIKTIKNTKKYLKN